MKRLRLTVRSTLGVLLFAYVLVIVALQIVWRTGLGDTWWTEVLNIFGLWLYLPLPFLLVAALFARPRALGALLVVPLLAFGSEYYSMLNWTPATPTGTAVRVMTWNILWDKHPLEPIVATIEAQQPDIVALQELGVTQAKELAPMLAQRYPYSAIDAAGFEGLGVWSRYPLGDIKPREERRAGCACQQMTVMVGDQQVQLINVHPEAPRYKMRHWRPMKQLPYFPIPVWFSTADQENAIQAIAEEARSTAQPLLVVGDFNVSDRQPNYAVLRRSLRDAYREAGQGFGLTFPNSNIPLGPFKIPPLIRIDYVFHNDDFAATAARTVADPVSDHRAVVADLVLVERPTAGASNP